MKTFRLFGTQYSLLKVDGVQLMQMVVNEEGSLTTGLSVNEEQFKSVAQITWKEALTIKLLQQK